MLRLTLYTLRSYTTRVPPKSLLKKQAMRLGEIPAPKTANLVQTSLRDVKALFQPSSVTEEDEELELQKRKDELFELIQNGEFTNLLQSKFQLQNDALLTSKLIANFSNLNYDQLELIKEAILLDSQKKWTEIPTYMKQLEYYMAYGSYGPRSILPFVTENGKPLDFTFKDSSNSNAKTARKLGKDEMIDLRTLYTSKDDPSKKRLFDPLTTAILIFATGITSIAALKEYKLTSKGESWVTCISTVK